MSDSPVINSFWFNLGASLCIIASPIGFFMFVTTTEGGAFADAPNWVYHLGWLLFSTPALFLLGCASLEGIWKVKGMKQDCRGGRDDTDDERMEGLHFTDERTPDEETICPKCREQRASITPTGIFNIYKCSNGHRWTYGDDGTLKWK